MPDGENPEEQPKDDLHSVLAAAVADSEKPETEKPVAQSGGDTVEAAEPEAVAGSEAAEPVAGAKPADETADSEKPAEDGKAKALEAPAHWAPKDKEAFAKAPRELQEWALGREKAITADYTKKTTEIAAFKRDWEPIDKMFAPYRDYMKQYGFTNEGLIGSWMKAEITLKNGGEPAYQLLRDVVKGYKLDPAQVATALGVQPAGKEQPAQNAEQPQADQLSPAIKAMLEPLLQEVGGIKTWVTNTEQQRQNERELQVMKSIEDFSQAKDDKGNLLHPHFAEVEADMARMAGAARTSKEPVPPLDKLYETAVWANTSTRQKLLDAQSAASEAQRKASEEKKAKEARAKAVAARNASKPVTGAPGSGQPPVGKAGALSIRESLMAAADEIDS